MKDGETVSVDDGGGEGCEGAGDASMAMVKRRAAGDEAACGRQICITGQLCVCLSLI